MVDNNNNSLHPRVLVTGADGFIGSHLTELLLRNGYEVTALAQYNSFGTVGWLQGLQHPHLKVVSGDIRDAAFCRRIAEGQQQIFHLAALIAIPYSYVAPESYVDTNIGGTLNILQAARSAKVERILITSTSEVYGTARYVPIDEKHERQPQSPYSATKIAADALAKSFYLSMDTPVVIVRPFNTYGPRQSARAIIPALITQMAAGKQVIKVGDLTPTRDFNFVADTARGFMAIAQAPVEKVVGQEINIATGREVTMRQTLDTIAQLIGWQGVVEVEKARLRPAKSEVRRLLGCNTKITTLTDWHPEYDLKRGLQATIDWFIKPENLGRYPLTFTL